MERRRSYVLDSVWKSFIVFMSLLCTGYSLAAMGEEVAAAILSYSTLTEAAYKEEKDLSTVEGLCKMIHCVDQMCYVDLVDVWLDISTQEKDFKPADWERLEAALEKIGRIRCWAITIRSKKPESPMPFSIAQMLIERTVAECFLEIDVPAISMRGGSIGPSTEEGGLGCEIGSGPGRRMPDTFLENNNWEETAPLSLRLTGCPSPLAEKILKCSATRKIKYMSLKDSDIEGLDLNEIIIRGECRVILQNLPKMERIVFPVGRDIQCKRVYLKEMPQLKEIVGLYEFLSTSRLEEEEGLSLDASTLKTCAEAFRRDIAGKGGEMLKIKSLCLYTMPYTFERLQSLFSFPWICAESLTLHIDARVPCSIAPEEVERIYSLDRVSSLGIGLLDQQGYGISIDSSGSIGLWTCEFIKSIASNGSELGDMRFFCSESIGSRRGSRGFYTSPPLRIHLEASEEIQGAIEKFQRKCDILCGHVRYSSIDIAGSQTRDDCMEALSNLFACMGESITVDALSFRDIKEGLSRPAAWEEVSAAPKAPKSKFILEALSFCNSNIDFIRDMIGQYSYAPGARIYIECGGFSAGETWRLCKGIMKHQPARIILQNALELMQRMAEGAYLADKGMGIRALLVLSVDNREWLMKHSHTIGNLSRRGFTLSAVPLSVFAKNSRDISESMKQLGCRLSLVADSVEEACMQLKKMAEATDIDIDLDCGVDVELFLCNSAPDSSATCEQASGLFELLGKLFMNVETLRISNLRIRQERDEDLYALKWFVARRQMHSLKYICLEHFTLASRKNPATSREEGPRTQYCAVGRKYSKKALVKMLCTRNILVDCRTLPSIQRYIQQKEKGSFPDQVFFWAKNLQATEECPICLGEMQDREIYIMHECGHWMCLDCAKKWSRMGEEAERRCPSCRQPIDLTKAPCFIRSIYPADKVSEKALTEEAFGVFETRNLESAPTE